MTGARRLLDIKDLKLSRAGMAELDGVSLTLDAGEVLVILGDVASGQDALLRVLGNFTERDDLITGTVRFGNGEGRPAQKRGTPNIRIVYLAAPRVTPLNPSASVASQLVRVVARNLNVPEASASEDLRLELARFTAAPSFTALHKKPDLLREEELAWAMLAAMAAQTPDLLIADHAFSGLTPTAVEALTRALMAEQKRQRFALVYFAEALQTAAHLRCRMIVLRRGKVIEEGEFEKLASGQSHAYTQTLFKALPRLVAVSPARSATRGEPLLQVQNLDISSRRKRRVPSRDAISFELRRGAALAFVGERRAGLRALVRTILGQERFANGRVVLDQVDLSILSPAMRSRLGRRIAFVTGSDAALDPRMTLWDTVDEPLRAHLHLPRDLIAGYRESALKRVGLFSHDGRRAGATLSTFDKRRLQVARAIVSSPILAVIDEPLRGLDAFAQSIMIELLGDLRRLEGPAFLIITADMRVAQALADDVMVFKDGKLVERGALAHIMRSPKDGETRRLLAAAAPGERQSEPRPDEEQRLAEIVPFAFVQMAEPEATDTPAPIQALQQEELDPPIVLDQPMAEDGEPGESELDENAVTEGPG